MSVTSVWPASPEAGLGVSQPSDSAVHVGKSELIDGKAVDGNLQSFEILGDGDGRRFRIGRNGERTRTYSIGRILGDIQVDALVSGSTRSLDRGDPLAVVGDGYFPVAVGGDEDRSLLAGFEQTRFHDGDLRRRNGKCIDLEFLCHGYRTARAAVAFEDDETGAILARIVLVDGEENTHAAAVAFGMGEVDPLLDIGGPPRAVRTQFEIDHFPFGGEARVFDFDLLAGNREERVGISVVAPRKTEARDEQQGGCGPE